MVGNEGDVLVGTQQNGNLMGWNTSLKQFTDATGHLVEHVVVVVFSRQELDVDTSAILFALGVLLSDIRVGLLQLWGIAGIDFTFALILELGSRLEETVVEDDNVLLRPIVGVEGLHLELFFGMRKLALNVVEQSPVARAPAIDALLDVAHDEVAAAAAHGLAKQHLEILPLHRTGVLELVDHHMVELCANLLEDERRVAAVDERVEQLLGVAEQEAVALLVELAHLLLDAVEQSQLTKIAQGEVGTLIEHAHLGTGLLGLLQQRNKLCIGHAHNECIVGTGLRGPI